jgi:hypothetical protein
LRDLVFSRPVVSPARRILLSSFLFTERALDFGAEDFSSSVPCSAEFHSPLIFTRSRPGFWVRSLAAVTERALTAGDLPSLTESFVSQVVLAVELGSVEDVSGLREMVSSMLIYLR